VHSDGEVIDAGNTCDDGLVCRVDETNSPLRRLCHGALAIAIFAGLAGLNRLLLLLLGFAAWTLLEYLVHRSSSRYSGVGQRLTKFIMLIPAIRTPNGPASARRCLPRRSVSADRYPGDADGSAMFAGLLSGYLVFIAVHYACTAGRSGRAPGSIRPGCGTSPIIASRLQLRRDDELLDIVFRTHAGVIGGASVPEWMKRPDRSPAASRLLARPEILDQPQQDARAASASPPRHARRDDG